MAEGGLVPADPVDGAVDRVQVHGGLHRGELLGVLEVPVDRLVGDLLDEVAAPVPLIRVRVEGVEGALEHRVGHLLDAVERRLGHLERRGEGLVRSLARPRVAPNAPAHLLQVELGREGLRRRGGQEGEPKPAIIAL